MKLLRFVLPVGLAALALLGWSYRTALLDPVVRHGEVALLPAGGVEKELSILLMSDIHVAGPDMPPRRLAGIVDGINALRPDVILIAGDLVSDKRVSTHTYSLEQAIAPLAGLKSRLGVYAVLGNHDHWRGADTARRELRRAGITVLDNEAARAGPLVIGGLDMPSRTTRTSAPRLPRWRAWAGFQSCSATAPTPSRACRTACG